MNNYIPFNLKVFEISKSEFDRLANCDEVYFTNGCLFTEDSDNLIAFPWYSRPDEEPETYFKVLLGGLKNVK